MDKPGNEQATIAGASLEELKNLDRTVSKQRLIGLFKVVAGLVAGYGLYLLLV